MRLPRIVLLLALVLPSGLAVANAQAAADFYAGKQIELIVGSGSGGGYASPDTLDYMKKLLTNAGGG
jgi:tripartite-type tricarboxylate transporter receptor subunit TctC